MMTISATGETVPSSRTRGTSRRTSPAEYPVGSRSLFLSRTVRVPLVALDDETWRDVRRIALLAARFANALLAEQYCRRRGMPLSGAYTAANKLLSSSVRDGVRDQFQAIWHHHGCNILAGRQRLALFSADRALAVRGEDRNGPRGVKLRFEAEDQYVIGLNLHPGRDVATVVRVWMPALKKDPWLRELLGRLWRGVWRVPKATVEFERPGRKGFGFVQLSLSHSGGRDRMAARLEKLYLLVAPFPATGRHSLKRVRNFGDGSK